MPNVRVLICDDHTIIREGLRLLLESEKDIEVIGEVQDGRQAVQEARRLRPDVVLMDLAMPLLNGVEATRQITSVKDFNGKVLILSSYFDSQHLEQAITAGALGYLLKESAPAELISAIREINKGNAFFSPAVFAILLKLREKAFTDPPEEKRNDVELTWREREVIQLVAEGYATKQIADLLSISKKTADKHRQTLMAKLHIHKVAGLTRYAVAAGIVEANRPPDLAQAGV